MKSRVMPARGLASLRTLTGQSDKRVPAHKAYLRVSFLELERARHDQEMGTARARIERMMERCREIDKEKTAILVAIGQPSAAVIATPAAVRTLRAGRRRFGVSY
jgi:hypothetical protein